MILWSERHQECRLTYRRTPDSCPRCKKQSPSGFFSLAFSLRKRLSLSLSELCELASVLYDLCFHRKACAKRNWIGLAWHAHGHRSDADALHDNPVERVFFNVCGCLTRRLYTSKWTVGTVRGKEGSAFAGCWGWCEWFVDCNGEGCRLVVKDSLFGFLGGILFRPKGVLTAGMRCSGFSICRAQSLG